MTNLMKAKEFSMLSFTKKKVIIKDRFTLLNNELRGKMSSANKNSSLANARDAKKDEFYTQLTDIEKELRYYKDHFKDKVVYCNCDDPRVSAFFHYFSYNFEKLGLKRLITTCYKSKERDLFSQNCSDEAIMLEYNGVKDGDSVPDPDTIGIVKLRGDGDFRSKESIELLKQADIVVTNPPFSLFRDYIKQLIDYNKKFLIIGNLNAVTYREVFPLFKNNKVWFGPSIRSGDREFGVPDSYPLNASGTRTDEKGKKYIRVKGVRWFTNLDHKPRHEDIILYKEYSEDEYPKYDNYDAIEVSKTKEIPSNYDGVMGVPITFMDKYNPDQFEILGITKSWADGKIKIYPKQTQISANGKESQVTKLNDGATIELPVPPKKKTYYRVDGKIYIQLYARILIKRKSR